MRCTGAACPRYPTPAPGSSTSSARTTGTAIRAVNVIFPGATAGRPPPTSPASSSCCRCHSAHIVMETMIPPNRSTIQQQPRVVLR